MTWRRNSNKPSTELVSPLPVVSTYLSKPALLKWRPATREQWKVSSYWPQRLSQATCLPSWNRFVFIMRNARDIHLEAGRQVEMAVKQAAECMWKYRCSVCLSFWQLSCMMENLNSNINTANWTFVIDREQNSRFKFQSSGRIGLDWIGFGTSEINGQDKNEKFPR